MLLPENAPEEYKDRAILWNAVEKVEKAKNSQLAREIEVAIPRELHFTDYFPLLLDYVKTNFTNHGMCADLAIHDNGKGNPHAHIMLTMRPLNEDIRYQGGKRKPPKISWQRLIRSGLGRVARTKRKGGQYVKLVGVTA